jgi:hypothetical protein
VVVLSKWLITTSTCWSRHRNPRGALPTDRCWALTTPTPELQQQPGPRLDPGRCREGAGLDTPTLSAAVAVAAHISRIAEALPEEVLHISLTNEGFHLKLS